MKVTKSIRVEEVNRQVDRILSSREFRKSDVLKRFLRFVTREEAAGHEDQIKESTLAIEVFERAPDFDSRADNVVRVHAHRLRSKLSKYYATEGANDPIRIEIPTGHYYPRFSRISGAPTSPQETNKELSGGEPDAARVAPDRNTPRRMAIYLIAVGVLIFATGWLMGSRQPADSEEIGSGVAEVTGELGSLEPVWGGFWRDDTPVLVVYRNPVFLRTSRGYARMMRYDGRVRANSYERIPLPADAHPLAIDELGNQSVSFDDTWTETASVECVKRLTEIFSAAGKRLALRRSPFLTAEDIRTHHLVVVGAPWGNDFLQQIHHDLNFVYGHTPNGIVNREPLDGEKSFYTVQSDTKTGALRMCPSLLTVIPGFAPGKKILVASASNSVGAQGIGEYVMSIEGIRSLEAAFSEKGLLDGGSLPNFYQVLLEVERVQNGAAKTTIVALREVSASPQGLGPSLSPLTFGQPENSGEPAPE